MSYAGKYNFGFSKPFIAKYSYDASTQQKSYSDGFLCGEGVSTTVTPAYANAKQYGDNRVCEEVNEFTSAAVELTVTKMPLKASEVLFGHTVDDTSEYTEVSKGGDTANYVGYGFTTKNSDGTYDACVLTKVKFTEGADGFTTKGDSITFKNPVLSGSAVEDETGTWREKKFGFASEADALEWVQTKLGPSASRLSGLGE